jgi:peptidyl-prolyl cis-trans isomerase C
MHLMAALCIALLHFGSALGEEINPVVGKAGDFVMREADLERLLGSQSPEIQKAVADDPEQRRALIRQLLLTKSVASRARKDGFDRKPEVKELLSNLVDRYLAQEYIARVVTANITVTDDEQKAYYKEHEKDFLLPESVKVRQIFISSPKDSSQTQKDNAKVKAERILQLVKKGEDFAKLATEYSEDSDTATKGGELGLLSPGKTNSPEFEKGVFALKAGAADIVETEFGYHIIKADERYERRTATFDETRDYIQNVLKEQGKQEAAQQFLEKISKETGLEVIDEKPAMPKLTGMRR